MSSSRPDARRKASGAARYSQDLYPPQMLHGALVRSRYSAARITSIALSDASRMSGAVSVLGPDDVPAEKGGDVIHDEPILAQEVVRYVGEPIALVAAESFAQARAAASQVRVEYEPLPSAIT